MAKSYQEVSSQGAFVMPDCVKSFSPAPTLVGDGRLSQHLVSAAQSERKLMLIIKNRRLRQKLFSADLFADPAWDMLLDLALAELRQQRVTVASLCAASDVPQTTALRWIKHLTDTGLIVRTDDPLDGRRKFMSLSSEGSTKMRSYLEGMSDVAMA